MATSIFPDGNEEALFIHLLERVMPLCKRFGILTPCITKYKNGDSYDYELKVGKYSLTTRAFDMDGDSLVFFVIDRGSQQLTKGPFDLAGSFADKLVEMSVADIIDSTNKPLSSLRVSHLLETGNDNPDL